MLHPFSSFTCVAVSLTDKFGGIVAIKSPFTFVTKIAWSYLKCLLFLSSYSNRLQGVYLKLNSVKQSSLFLLALDQCYHCPPSECDLNLTWMEFCFREDFQPARREIRCSKPLFHSEDCRQRFHTVAAGFVAAAGQRILLVFLSLHYIMRDLIILFIGLPASTLSCVCNFLLMRFLSSFIFYLKELQLVKNCWKNACAKIITVHCLLLKL